MLWHPSNGFLKPPSEPLKSRSGVSRANSNPPQKTLTISAGFGYCRMLFRIKTAIPCSFASVLRKLQILQEKLSNHVVGAISLSLFSSQRILATVAKGSDEIQEVLGGDSWLEKLTSQS